MTTKTYNIILHKDLFELLDEAILFAASGKENNPTYEVTEEKPGPMGTEYQVTIEAESDNIFFRVGYYLERMRQEKQRRHYDLHDMSALSVDVPEAFILVCQFYGIHPSLALTFFAGDLCKHPFKTSGSDEREMALDYWKRGNYLDEDKQSQADELFERLDTLRRSWGGNNQMEEFKFIYTQELKKLKKVYIDKKKK